MIIMNPADIAASVDAWSRHGDNAPLFNDAAAGLAASPRTVSMAPANDVCRPGILGLNR